MNAKIKLFIVTKSTAGVGEYARWLAQDLDKEIFDLTLACMSEGGADLAAELSQLPGVTAFFIPMNRYNIDPISDWKALMTLRRQIRAGNFDLIHSHASKPGFLARLAAIGTGQPVYYSPHCFAFHQGTAPWKAQIIAFFERVAARFLTQKILTVAEAEIDLAQQYKVGRPEQFITIHSGIETQQFAALPNDDKLRTTLGIPSAAPVVGVIGRLNPQKNPLGFVDVARQVHQENQEIHFVWVGDGPLMSAVQEKIAIENLRDSFHLVGFRSDISAFLALFDVFVLPSRWEAFPITILEAMAAGLPVIATAVSGVPEMVLDGETGWLVPPDDALALVYKINDVIDDKGKLNAIGNKGQKHVKQYFSRVEMIKKLTKVYQSAVDLR